MNQQNKNTNHFKEFENIENLKFAIVTSEWNFKITDRLTNGLEKELKKNGVLSKNIDKYSVPGSFELIHACSSLINNFQYSAIIVVGCIIKGQTYHFECISNSVANSIGHLNSLGRTPVVFCVLTDNNIQQSLNRSGGKYGNKKEEAAITALRMATLKFK